jgi:hypothetical protein
MQTPTRTLARSFAIAVLSAASLAIPLDVAAATKPQVPPKEQPPAPPPDCAAPTRVDACDAGWFGRVAERARRGLVRVSTHLAWGTGFLLDDRHVATHFDIVARPQNLVVYSDDGRAVGAQVVVGDASEGIAILELSAPLPGTPLELSAAAPEVDQAVVAIGVPPDFGSALPRPFLSIGGGKIRSRDDDRLATDTLRNVHNQGGPLLDCHGRVLGVLTPPTTNIADPNRYSISAGKLRAAWAAVGRRPRYTGRLVVPGIEYQLISAQLERKRLWLGESLSFPVAFAERWEIAPRVGIFVALDSGISSPIETTSRLRGAGDLRLRYRIPVTSAPFPITLVPGAGVALHYDFERKQTFTASFDVPACTDPAAVCTGQLTPHDQFSHQLSWLPSLGLDAHFDIVSMGYELRVSTVPNAHAIHMVTLGISSF